MKLIFEAPINSLSFGNVAINLLREMWRKTLLEWLCQITAALTDCLKMIPALPSK